MGGCREARARRDREDTSDALTQVDATGGAGGLGDPRPSPDRSRGSRGAVARGERGSIEVVTSLTTETVRVSGVRCERCVGRLAGALRGHDGLEFANANLLGDVTLSWDADRTTRADLVAALARAGFREAPSEPLP